VVQDVGNGRVLMLGYMNREALERTLTSGHTWFYSRSRQELWEKGATSGHYLAVRGVRADCDGDALLVLAEPAGPTCHTGVPSCFFNQLPTVADAPPVFEAARELFELIQSRKEQRPEGSYVARLFDGGVDRIGKKIGEEATEVVIAAKNADRNALVWEVADLWFHTYVLLAEAGLTPQDIWHELAKRRR
jgi:phosphoribosyl-ATP pyrophosphohydrolase/phosphoribosyl-AMP cyclohydrolase